MAATPFASNTSSRSTAAGVFCRWRVWLAGFLALVALQLGRGVASEESAPGEYEVKAAFLFHFAQFVDWPARTFPSSEAPVVIGILGEDPFGSVLDGMVKGESIGARPLAVKRLASESEISGCQILFVSRSEKKIVPTLLQRLKEQPVLTVSEVDHFCEAGGAVHFIIEDTRVRFEINPDAPRLAGIKVNSNLLRVGRIVQGRTPAAPPP